jgi:hypothetical protein
VRLGPTVVQAFADEHATAWRKLSALVGVGIRWMDQRRPFHSSARPSVWGRGVRPLTSLYPTAVHALADEHDTPESRLSPAGLGMLWIDQRRPFHRSANDMLSLPSVKLV